MKAKWLKDVGAKTMSRKRMALLAAAALGLYSLSGEGYSYVSTATHLVSQEIRDHVPLSFEIERAKTMIAQLTPDIKHNMVVIAEEEAGVESLREDIAVRKAALTRQHSALLELRDQANLDEASSEPTGRSAKDVDRELERLFHRYRVGEGTLSAKEDLLASREESLLAARANVETMLNTKRDLEVQVENLEARLRTVERQAVARHVEFDESEVSRCQALVSRLKARVDGAEQLLLVERSEPLEDLSHPTVHIRDDIDRYFAQGAR